MPAISVASFFKRDPLFLQILKAIIGPTDGWHGVTEATLCVIRKERLPATSGCGQFGEGRARSIPSRHSHGQVLP